MMRRTANLCRSHTGAKAEGKVRKRIFDTEMDCWMEVREGMTE